MTTTYKDLFYKAFENSNFGFEIEGCGVFYPIVEECNKKHERDPKQKNICFMNEIIKKDYFPKIIDSVSKNPVSKFVFDTATGYHEQVVDRGNKWIYEGDSSIVCQKTQHFSGFTEMGLSTKAKPTAAEIVSPILHMGRTVSGTEGTVSNTISKPGENEENATWLDIKSEILGNVDANGRDTFYEGLFITTFYPTLLFNNDIAGKEAGKAARLYPAGKNMDDILSTGFHMHYSNNDMKSNNIRGKCTLLYAMRHMACFEKTFMLFLDAGRSKNRYCKVLFEQTDRFNLLRYKNYLDGTATFNREYYGLCLIDSEHFGEKLHNYYEGTIDRYWSMNLTHAYKQFQIASNDPIHIEFRVHHGTIYTKEIHHWICFLNCFMASCIAKVKSAYKKASDGDDGFTLEKLIKEINDISINFNSPDLQGRQSLINLLFKEFVPDKELCYYYMKKANFYKETSFVPTVDEESLIRVVCPLYYDSISEPVLEPGSKPKKITIASLNKMKEESKLVEYSKTIGLDEYKKWMEANGKMTGGNKHKYDDDIFSLKHSKYFERINKIEKMFKGYSVY